MDLLEYRARLEELVTSAEIVEDAADRDAFIDSCLAAGHRRHFFAAHRGGAVLYRRGKTIFDAIAANNVVHSRSRAGKDPWQHFCENRKPISLATIVKIDEALGKIAAHASKDVRELTLVNKKPFEMEPATVIASIYWADPGALLDYRVSQTHDPELPRGREKISKLIFGPQHSNTLEILERGDKGRHARVTRATVKRMAAVLGEDIEDLFTFDHSAGLKNGEATFALLPSQGNIVKAPPVPPPVVDDQAAA